MLARAVLLLLALQGGGLSLRWKPKEGDEIRYRTVGEFQVNGSAATITAVNRHKVIRVDDDGGFLVEASPEESKAVFGGQEFPGKGVTIQTRYGPDGEVKEIRNGQTDAIAYRMAILNGFHAPTKPVAVGDAWTAEGKADAKLGTVAWKADYKVVAEESVNGVDTVKIEASTRETEGTEAGKTNGFIWVGKDGILTKEELTWTNVSVPGSPVPITGKYTLTRL